MFALPYPCPGKSNIPSDKWTIILAMGGPGTGKSTQCDMLQLEFNVWHLDVHKLTKNEMTKSGILADMIAAGVNSGGQAPPELGVGLLKAAMTEASEKHGASLFLIEGFPQSIDHVQHFESEIGIPFAVLFFDSSFENVMSRLARRANALGVFDEDAADMHGRSQAFAMLTWPVVELYRQKSRFIHIDASGDVLEVYNLAKKHLSYLRYLSAEIMKTRR